ncbi:MULTISPECIES: hypothetical protein [Pseudomonas]|uniref:Uncharacterized protein n=1 Tax=Pseudomonas mosselii TaxID=78327 RepID=A0A5R8YKC3_9PSED|nr:hypothetical protein [Pseudomonas mosselii]TLP53487.1 hypothetical protein FEM01_23035 [Pseudomonas mosselii]
MDRAYNTAPAHTAPRRSYLSRHWRGELSLTRTFWLNGVAVRLLFDALATPQVETLLGNPSRDPIDSAYLAGVLIGISLILWLWQLVGLWRCARRHSEFVGVVVPLLIVAVLAHYTYTFTQGFIPGFIKSFNEQLEYSRQSR